MCPVAPVRNGVGNLRPMRVRRHGYEEIGFAKSPWQRHRIQIPAEQMSENQCVLVTTMQLSLTNYGSNADCWESSPVE